MKDTIYTIPEGRRDYIFEDASLKRKICNKLTSIFESAGYGEIMTPAAEFSRVFGDVNEEYVPETDICHFTDSKNRLMALRCDCTVPIARVAATKTNGIEPPYRFFYCQNIITSTSVQGSLAETTQCGVELIGTQSSLNADIEILELSAKSMKELFGLDFNIEIGHGKLYTTLAKAYNIDKETSEKVRKLIETKNFAALESLDLPEPLRLLPKMFGRADNDKDIALLDSFAEKTKSKEIKEITDYIKTLISELRKRGYGSCLSFDLGLVGRLDYYTGIIFGGFVRGLGHAVLSGGRYDNLTARFGREMAATGFGINADDVFDLMKSEKTEAKAPDAPLRIALTKGRLEEKTIALMEQNGVDCTTLRNKGRKLLFPLCDGKIEIMLVKPFDVITYVEHGVCDLGVVGLDTISEHGTSLYEIADLGFGKCHMMLAANKEYKDNPEKFFDGYSKKIIATKFVNTARRYIESKGIDADIIKIEGSVELAPILKLADGIVDIVETGTTLRENGLEVVEKIFPVSARIVANIAAMKLRKNDIDKIITEVFGQ